MATHTHTRRRIMAAMGALPIAALAAPALAQAPSADTAEWDAAYRAWLPVAAEWAAFDIDSTIDDDEAWKAFRARVPFFQAQRDAFMAVPAPTVAALLVKIEIVAVSQDDDHADSMLADARRLLGGKA